MKIILFGSTYISSLASLALGSVGHEIFVVPSISPLFGGDVHFPIVSTDNLPEHDIKLSVQFDRRIKDIEHAFNLHTGLLPEYGGCDILYHTLENGATEQGLTFHSMGPDFDEGEIISKISYPVLPEDDALSLYKKICLLVPFFAVSSVAMLEKHGLRGVASGKPTLYYRGKVKDKELYEAEKLKIANYIKHNA